MVAGGIGILVLLLLILRAPYLIALYQLYWSGAGIQRLFYEDLGFSSSWSQFIGVVASFVYALAWVPLTLWTYRLLAWRFDARQLGIAFVSWVAIYGHAPLLHALLGTDACFNQQTGAPMKWYSRAINGQIMLSDSGGFDPVTGQKRELVTPQICADFAKQRTQYVPRKITGDIRTITFFDPVDGRPHVWYSKLPNGQFEFFDAPGFNPATSEALLPVSKGVVAQAIASVVQQEELRAANERATREEAEKRRQEQIEQERRRQQILRQHQEEMERAAAEARARQEQQRQEELARRRQQDEEAARQRALQQQQEFARQQELAQRRAAWRSTHNGCDLGTYYRCCNCQTSNAPECLHIGGNGGCLCAP